MQGAPSLYGVLNFLSGPHWSPRTPAERVLKYHWTVLEHSVCEVLVCHLCMLALLCQKAQLLKYPSPEKLSHVCQVPRISVVLFVVYAERSSSSSAWGLLAEAQVTALMVVHQVTEEKGLAGFLLE